MWRASLARLLPEYIMLDHWAEEPVRVVVGKGGELPTMRFGASLVLVLVLVVKWSEAEEWRPILKQLSRQSRRADGGHGHFVAGSSHHQGGVNGRSGRVVGGVRQSQHTRHDRPRPQEARRGRDGHAAPAPVAEGYGGPKEEPVDLHNKEFCVDVSTFDPVTWVEREGQECETVFEKACEEKTEKVCADVTETTCKVEPYTVCEMGLEPQNKVSTMLAPKLFVEKTCTQGKKEIPHTKLLPECRNVTKQNCVTLWETDADGKQVKQISALIVNNKVRKVSGSRRSEPSSCFSFTRCGRARTPASR